MVKHYYRVGKYYVGTDEWIFEIDLKLKKNLLLCEIFKLLFIGNKIFVQINNHE